MKTKKLFIYLAFLITLILTTNTYEKNIIFKETLLPGPNVNTIGNLNEKYIVDASYNLNKHFSNLAHTITPAETYTKKDDLFNLPFKYGDRGESIEGIQKLLNKYGYALSIDSIFGASTQDAIINFQHRLGLEVDGIVGEQTLAKLNILPTSITMYNPKELLPVQSIAAFSSMETAINSKGLFSSTSYYVVIDTKNQRVNVFTGYKDNWKLIQSMPCSTGALATPTVKGFFSIEDKGNMFRAGSNTICKYYTRFSGNYLFHTILLDNKGNIQDPTLGTPLSHGCVRLSIEDAKYIYYNIPFGTTVWSY